MHIKQTLFKKFNRNNRIGTVVINGTTDSETAIISPHAKKISPKNSRRLLISPPSIFTANTNRDKAISSKVVAKSVFIILKIKGGFSTFSDINGTQVEFGPKMTPQWRHFVWHSASVSIDSQFGQYITISVV